METEDTGPTNKQTLDIGHAALPPYVAVSNAHRHTPQLDISYLLPVSNKISELGRVLSFSET